MLTLVTHLMPAVILSALFAPPPSCNEAGEVVTYTPPGECLDNACQFMESTSSCEEGLVCFGLCDNGSDRCVGIVCNVPPVATCTSRTLGVVYSATGACVEGEASMSTMPVC